MMKEILAAIISCIPVIVFGYFAVIIYREFKRKKERRELLYFAQKRLHKLALQYRDDCITETMKVIERYTSVLDWKSYRRTPDYMTYAFLSEYSDKIELIKNDYLVNYAEKYSDGDKRLQIEAEDLLTSSVYLEYEAELSEIEIIFWKIYCCMYDQIKDLKENTK